MDGHHLDTPSTDISVLEDAVGDAEERPPGPRSAVRPVDALASLQPHATYCRSSIQYYMKAQQMSLRVDDGDHDDVGRLKMLMILLAAVVRRACEDHDVDARHYDAADAQGG